MCVYFLLRCTKHKLHENVQRMHLECFHLDTHARAVDCFCCSYPAFLDMRGQQVTWPQFTSDNQMVLTFDTQMSSESADNVTDWSAMADFWVAIDALAQWADVDGK